MGYPSETKDSVHCSKPADFFASSPKYLFLSGGYSAANFLANLLLD